MCLCVGEDSDEEALLDLIVAFDAVDRSLKPHFHQAVLFGLVWFGAVQLGMLSSLQAFLYTGNGPITGWTGYSNLTSKVSSVPSWRHEFILLLKWDHKQKKHSACPLVICQPFTHKVVRLCLREGCASGRETV